MKHVDSGVFNRRDQSDMSHSLSRSSGTVSNMQPSEQIEDINQSWDGETFGNEQAPRLCFRVQSAPFTTYHVFELYIYLTETKTFRILNFLLVIRRVDELS